MDDKQGEEKMKPEISIILPAIRRENWDKMYDSIMMSTGRKFELIICGPYSLTEKLQSLRNVKYIKDFGCSTRATQLASLLAEGEYMMWAGDDTIFQRNAVDYMINILKSMKSNYKNVVCGKYLEGANGTKKVEWGDFYYKINGKEGFRPCTYSPYIPDDWWIFNAALMHRRFFEELGGLDCGYEHLAMAATDFAIRAQVSDAVVRQTQIYVYDCDHSQSDHVPIEIAQLHYDNPKIQAKYRDPNWREKLKINIDMDNWRDYPSVWKRRFS